MASVPEGPWAKVGVVATVIGVAVAIYFGFSSSKNATGTTLPTPPGRSSTVSSSTSAPATTGSSIYWSGPVGFTSYGLDLDIRRPATDQTTIAWEGNELQATANAQLAAWTQPGTPSPSQCQNWVTTHPNNGVPTPTIGMQICIKTDQGRFGLLHIDSYSNNGSQLNATATIWGS